MESIFYFLQPNSQVHYAYDALQLAACNIPPVPKSSKKPLLSENKVLKNNKADITIYADSNNGDDNNPGTSDKPVKTVYHAVDLYRGQKTKLTDEGMIILAPGDYYLTDTLDLGHDDSHLTMQGDKSEPTLISGGKQYTFQWDQFIHRMEPQMNGINAINGAVLNPGDSSYMATFVSSMNSSDECQKACAQENTCFAYTWHGPSTGAFANMCYFRADGLWVPTTDQGCISGKKLNIMVADLSKQAPIPFTSLFINGRRAVRARYPDGNPETMGLHTNPTGYVSKADSWMPPQNKGKSEEIHIESPERNGTHFPQFQIGIGGPVAVFNPPQSYWGTTHPTGGGGSTYIISTGLVYSAQEGFVNRTWTHPETGVVHAFHCKHWGNWQFAVKGRDNTKREIQFDYGGYQEARGCLTGAEWYVENIFEELDAPGEWFYNETEMKLYLYPNSTLPTSGVGTVLKRLVNVQGSMDSPVYNIAFMNITFAHTQPTYLDLYEVPSGGDWSIHREGAVFAEGVEGLTIHSCRFDSPGGNGIFLSNYIRKTLIKNNEFFFTGDSAIASVGLTQLIDGTNGNQPRGNLIANNVMREIGIFGKQTSAYIQALTAQTTFSNNVFFNGPRAGINFNDGFGGGHNVVHNLGFNMVRETGDHGPFNSWDRQPYLTKVKDGMTPSLQPATTNLTQNFLINNYHSAFPIDHDDGSCYYYDTYNFLIYGGSKSHFGRTKVVKYNLYIYPDAVHSLVEESIGKTIVIPFCAFSHGASIDILGWGEMWSNNSCIIGNPNVYDFVSCDPDKSLKGIVPFTSNNKFYTPNKDIYIKCKNKNFSLAEFQSMGYDIGSTVSDVVDTDTIVAWGKEILGM